ncbi:MAG: hypothetical protein AB1411_01890 [Nitrospirota bacterium]
MRKVLMALALGLAGCASGTVWEHQAGGSAGLQRDIQACREAEVQRAKEFDPNAQFILRERIPLCLQEKGYVPRPARFWESATEY